MNCILCVKLYLTRVFAWIMNRSVALWACAVQRDFKNLLITICILWLFRENKIVLPLLFVSHLKFKRSITKIVNHLLSLIFYLKFQNLRIRSIYSYNKYLKNFKRCIIFILLYYIIFLLLTLIKIIVFVLKAL